MSNTNEWFRKYESFSKSRLINSGDGSCIHALGKGKINIKTFNGRTWIPSVIENVLYVPSLKCNLLSAWTVLDKGNEMQSDNEIRKQQKMYEMIFEVEKEGIEPLATNQIGVKCKQDHIKTWYQHLGHQDMNHVREILKRNNICFIDIKDKFFCEPCVMEKQLQLPSQSSSSKAKSS
ncbi:hypothetical protein JTB14_029118 [Gonioctena quinquepunctata]|nr:hypothetical protein JTB14_029118 [Gonioctena quinquepunctata]